MEAAHRCTYCVVNLTCIPAAVDEELNITDFTPLYISVQLFTRVQFDANTIQFCQYFLLKSQCETWRSNHNKVRSRVYFQLALSRKRAMYILCQTCRLGIALLLLYTLILPESTDTHNTRQYWYV
jgi:hypothetical protein